MVRFSVFNELSLPLNQHQVIEKFGVFFGLLAELKKLGLNQIRMSKDFKTYSILENTSFQQFLGQQSDRDFKTRLRSFVNNAVIEIDIPIINEDDLEQSDQQNSCEYFYKQKASNGGLACCDIWDTLSVSFNSSEEWNKPLVSIQKTIIFNDTIIENEIKIKHASTSSHLDKHSVFFQNIESENQLNITQENFWKDREKHFPNILIFCPEVGEKIHKLDKVIFQQAISLLRDVETQRKLITDFNYSGEGLTVHNNPKLYSKRKFTINGKKVFFENHIKSLPNGYRIYFLQQNEVIYIGSIANHFSTGKHK